MKIGRVVVGALIGAVIGFVAAVNVVIYSGAEDGYETSLPEVFDRSVALGVVVVAFLLVGPIVGGVVAWRSGGR